MKKQYTKSELTDLVEAATREALSKILNEGVGFEFAKAAFKRGMDGDFNDVDFENDDYGFGEPNYDEYKRSRAEYKAAKNRNKMDKAAYKTAKADYDSGKVANSTVGNAKAQLDKSSEARTDAAVDTVANRPGIIGKAQRQAAVGAARLGHGIHKIKKAGEDFKHNKLGI